MTARDIQRALIISRYQRNFVIPNYTPRDWYECDLYELTNAGFATEYEIKLSVSDFRADKKKERKHWKWDDTLKTYKPTMDGTKHQNLCDGITAGPRRFFYVMPESIVSVVIQEVPDWAGIISVTERPGYSAPWNVLTSTARPAPKLHNCKADVKIKQHAESVFYWRFHKLFLYGKFEVENECEPIANEG